MHTHCIMCGEAVAPDRWVLGYRTCLYCGEQQAKAESKYHITAPLNKSNYLLITDLTQLRQLNPKRTT